VITDINHRVHTEKWRIAPHVIRLETSIIREILKISSQPGIISFAGGLPAPDLFPIELIKHVTAEALDTYGSDVLQYGLSRGVPQLVKVIAERATERGTPSTSENILVTTGAQQGIELIARAFIDPGDYILVENPTYLGALQAFDYYQAQYATVDMDSDGLLIDQVEEKIRRHKPKLIYTVSNFQNPTGITMSVERRRALVDLAIQYDIPIVDDNPYGDVHFTENRLPTIKSYGGDEVIALRSFSKIISPGLRLGWINGPKDIVCQFEKVKQCADLHTSTFCQFVIYEFIRHGYLEPHIEKIRSTYRAKRDRMLQALEAWFPVEVKWTHPEGGLFIWLELPKSMSAKELFPKAIDMKVAYVYGSPFFANGGGDNTMRLNFSCATMEEIDEGIKRLGRLVIDNM
jgi:2-aminoadipate transaminase